MTDVKYPFQEDYWKTGTSGFLTRVTSEDEADVYDIRVGAHAVRVQQDSDGHFSPSPWELRTAMIRMFDRGRHYQARVISDAISYKAGRR